MKCETPCALEFSSVADLFLNMDEKTTTLIEAARADWSRNRGKRQKAKKATAKRSKK
jgi:hypothetical protein